MAPEKESQSGIIELYLIHRLTAPLNKAGLYEYNRHASGPAGRPQNHVLQGRLHVGSVVAYGLMHDPWNQVIRESGDLEQVNLWKWSR